MIYVPYERVCASVCVRVGGDAREGADQISGAARRIILLSFYTWHVDKNRPRCLCVCVYICVYIYIHMYMYIIVYIYAYVRIYYIYVRKLDLLFQVFIPMIALLILMTF